MLNEFLINLTLKCLDAAEVDVSSLIGALPFYPNNALLYSWCAPQCVFVVCVKAPVVCKNLSNLSGYAPLYRWGCVTLAKSSAEH